MTPVPQDEITRTSLPQGGDVRCGRPDVTFGRPPGCWFCGRGHLSSQESAVARLLAEGMSERRIAAELFISSVVLRTHIARICAKLGVDSPTELVHVDPDTAESFRFGTGSRGECLDRPAGHPHDLTPQEAAVARLVREGWSEREIAAELFIGTAAVRSHLAHLQEKLEVVSVESGPATGPGA